MAAKILIVDDERELVEAYARLLAQRGYSCLSAFDGDAAMQLIDSEHPDVILTDLNLPTASGLEVIRHAHESCPDARVIALTGYGTPAVRHLIQTAGARACLQKPISFAALNYAISAVLIR